MKSRTPARTAQKQKRRKAMIQSRWRPPVRPPSPALFVLAIRILVACCMSVATPQQLPFIVHMVVIGIAAHSERDKSFSTFIDHKNASKVLQSPYLHTHECILKGVCNCPAPYTQLGAPLVCSIKKCVEHRLSLSGSTILPWLRLKVHLSNPFVDKNRGL